MERTIQTIISWTRSKQFRWLVASSFAVTLLTAATVDHLLDTTAIDVDHYLEVTPSPILLDRQGRMLQVGLNHRDEWSVPIESHEYNRYIREATIAVEDQRFEIHSGVDFVAVARAATQALMKRRVSSGASTITMQLVKITDDTPRTLSGKLRQMWTAMVLERNATKQEILAAYLNRVSYGSNVVGVGAASLRYFGKPADELTIPEAALLAGIPKSPAKFDPLRKPDDARGRRNFVLRRMAREDFIPSEECVEFQNRDLNARWHEFPSHLPHLAGMKDGTLTIDLDEQKRSQKLLQEHLSRYGAEITHGAIIVLDVASGEVLARVGSPDFFSARGGQIDMVSQPRSPGSAMKPFVFAEAMERNLVYPTEVLLDGRLDYGDYAPENYNGHFNGLVSATEALQYSLNIPAVLMLERVGVRPFQNRLRELGISTAERPAEHYGLGLVLGNCEVRLDELAAAYLTLANLGTYRDVQILLNSEQRPPEKRVWSQGVARAMYAMLEQPIPKDLHRGLIRPDAADDRVCWKTGTSTGHHDAWAFVFNAQYVVGVWIGNTDGRRSDRLIGAQAALPLAGRIIRGLKNYGATAWPATDGLRTVEVCSISGLPKSAACPGSVSALVAGEQFLNRSCRVHQTRDERGNTITAWPASAHHWDLAAISPQPEFHALTTRPQESHREFRITSPADNSVFRMSNVKGGDRVRLDTSAQNGEPVHWYCNDRYLGQSSVDNPLFLILSPGEHRISCMGPDGAIDNIAIIVRT